MRNIIRIIPETDNCYGKKMIQGKEIENYSGKERTNLNRTVREHFF